MTAIEKKSDDLPTTINIPAMLKQLCGVQGENFLSSLLPDLVANFDDIKDPNVKHKAVIEALEALQPRDAYELMIQIVSLYRKGMDFLSRLSNSDKNANIAAKLLRLQSEKLESLMKYRRKGHQVVHVEHVHINQGGQAVIGNVQGGGG